MKLIRLKKPTLPNEPTSSAVSGEAQARSAYQTARWLWTWAIRSMPLDLGVLFLLPAMVLAPDLIEILNTATLLVIAICGLLAVAGAIPEAREKFGLLRDSLKENSSRLAWAVVVCIAIAIGAQLLLSEGKNIIAQVVSVIIAAGTAISVVKGIKTYQTQTASGPTAALTEERQLLALATLPIAASRLLSFFVVLRMTIGGETHYSFALIVWGTALALLLMNEPQEDQFIAVCKRCGDRVARVRRKNGVCERCRASSTAAKR